MLSKILFGLIAAKAAIASPILEPVVDFTPDTLAEAQELAKFLQDIQNQKIYLNQTEWEDLLTANGILLEPPPIDYDFLNFTAEVDVNVDVDVSVDINKRQTCGNTQAKRVTKTETFVDWDIQMSNVACARQSAIDIFVMSGISVTNTVSVSAGINPTTIKTWLFTSFGVSYSRAWQSNASNQNKATVQIGNCGAMVLNPTTTRRYGTISQGCIGHEKQIGTFMADDRFSASFNGVDWTGGSISDCQRQANNAPIARCQGSGNLV
ncbi:hypothetical protein Slin14017_G102220 [Septoria linicola]|nr:hypothetical protein Slin14017_G102220 [Septoria linicola]